MGSFVGHLVDGQCFIFLATWWMVNIYLNMFRSQTCKSATPWVTRFYYTGPSIARNLPIDSILKIVFGIISVCGETFTGMTDGVFVAFNNAQHMTIALFFVFSGVGDLVKHSKRPVPECLDGALLAMSFAVQSFMFLNHQHGTSPLEMLIHRFIIYVTAATAACIIYECHTMAGPTAALLRTFLVLLQGTWLIHIGFILYPPFSWMQPWNGESHQSLMLAPAIFTSHGLVAIIFMFLIGVIVFNVLKITDKSLQVKYCPLLQEE